MTKTKLTIELVPSTCWFSNVRSNVSKRDWDKLRFACYAKAGNICEICGGHGEKWPVECHEIWAYDDEKHTQTLTGLIALCPSCHEVKHIGLAQMRGRGEIAQKHLMKVNGWSADQAAQYIKARFLIWNDRSSRSIHWALNLDFLKNQGITYKESR